MSNNHNHCPMGTTPYIVKQGDTFYLIAKREGVSLEALLKANPGIDPNRLFIGQVICIPSSTPSPGPTHPCPTLAQGSRGSYVTDLQTRLKAQGFNPGTIDGIFGPNTKSSVIAFQRSKGLAQDGIVGVKTWAALGVNCGTTPPPSGKCPAGTFTHTIKSGENFYILANRYNVSVDSILKANPGVNPNTLQIGQVVCIPGTNPPTTPPSGKCPAGTFAHTIKSGENFFILGNRYNVSVDSILKANPGVNPNTLQIGQVVCIPNR